MLKRVLIFSVVLACAFAADEDTWAELDSQQTLPLYSGEKFKKAVEEYDHVTLPNEKCENLLTDEIKYTLYTREKPDGEVIEYSSLNISDSALNVKKPLKVIVHSWLNNKDWVTPLVLDYLYSQNVDVLMPDWSYYAKKCDIESTSLFVLPFVGKSLSYMLRQMISTGHSGSNMHLIGFGHGAHIVGIAGRLMAPHLPARITALDPVRLEEINRPGVQKLTGGDAKFIDVVVTSLPAMGFENEIGDVTFFPNGGFTKYQAGCSNKKKEWDKIICGHALAYRLFSESLVSPLKFPAVKCESYTKMLAGACTGEEGISHMGEYVEQNTRGRYYLLNNEQYPYDKGLSFQKSSSA